MQNVTIDRNKYIGGSDIPIILGISSFKTRWQLLQEKAGIAENTFSGNIYTEYGNVMEEKIRAYVNQESGKNFVEDMVIDGNLRGHLDGWNEETKEVLEIKTTSGIKDSLEEYEVYLVQMYFYMKLKGTDKGILAVYRRPEDFDEEFNPFNIVTYEVRLDNDKLKTIESEIEKFCTELEELKKNPFTTQEDLLPQSLVEASMKVIALENKLSAMKELEKELKNYKDSLKAAMEQNNIKSWTTPNGIKITLVPDGEDKTEDKFDEKAFKAENGELYEKYLVATVKKGRKGYVRVTL